MSPWQLSRARAPLGAVLIAIVLGAGLISTQHGAKPRQAAGDAFVRVVEVSQPVAVVWEAITRKAQVDRYYFVPLGADLTRAGARVHYGPPAAPMITGSVVTYRAPHVLEHTFRFTGDTTSPDTLVTYALMATAKGTRLSVTHSGYAVDSQGYADIAGGWPVILERLKAVLDARR